MAEPQIVAAGWLGDDEAGRLIEFVLGLTGKERPRVCLVPDTPGLHYVGTELREVVATRDGARAYRVESGAEAPIEPRILEKE